MSSMTHWWSSLVLLPPFHIMFGLIKQFLETLNKKGKCFQYIMSQFTQLSDAKLKEGIFDEPQIQQPPKLDVFDTKMTSTEKRV